MSTAFHEDELLGRAYDSRLMRRLLAYLRPYRGLVALSVVLLLLHSAALLAGPALLRVAIDRHIAPRRPEGLEWVVLAYLGTLGAAFAVRYLQNILMQLVGQRAMYDLRMAIFTHLQRLAVGFYVRTPVGRLLTRITNDVDALNELITQGVVAVFGDLVTVVGIVAVMLVMDWRLALVTFTVLPLILYVTAVFRARARDTYRAVRTRLARLNAYLNENLMGMAIVQLFNREARAFARFQGLNRDLLAAHLQGLRYVALFQPAVGVIRALAVALVLWVGGAALGTTVTIGLLVAFIQYAERFFEPIEHLAEQYNILQAAMASSERIFRLLDEPVEVADPPDPVPLERLRGEVEFRGVWFAYPPQEGAPDGAAEWVLRDLSFHIRPGESVALVGHTGAGKSSIINLLMRFYDPQRGTVVVDGVDVRRYAQRDLRRHIGLVLQDVFLFSGTVADNIRLGNREIDDAAVRRAAEFVNAHRFIERLPRGYQTEVKERGAILSVGQKQLIAFARAIAHNPEILLVLDEATSSVDTETEELIQEALRRVMHGRTSIIIAHRLSTIQHVDRILVLHKGRLVETGTHRELLARGGVYSKLYELQFAAVGAGRRGETGTGAG
ncbi:MAG: ABC transporter ATP-binding protein [Armatimonadota bacterium]|nr:ABC transporter ATP-binding protein [Armatimonadota bacterium]MDR7449742.1 ABC transporter ATP-binding protein [Armatimonadota bacterium]MDR7460326.1 ABC transporter ATP-binding protein [Armatimonadota bacterium]MDR7478984.1 ABC transporter ATP-binding protein [Armatimonadota bacterium]MDR7488497.1 ABC transporter ATP-binding protein [Armatimonadota bacterium]